MAGSLFLFYVFEYIRMLECPLVFIKKLINAFVLPARALTTTGYEPGEYLTAKFFVCRSV
jgi:hypothetical protein